MVRWFRQIEAELNASQEELNRTQRENANLKGRITDLEAQIETMSEMLSITNAELNGYRMKMPSGGFTGYKWYY